MSITLRTIAAAAALVAATASHALTIDASGLVANSVQAFSADAAEKFDVAGVTVTPLGNATAVADAATPTFSLPITSITVDNSFKIAGGAAVGSALQIARPFGTAGTPVGVTLANFAIDYNNKQVRADVKPYGLDIAPQQVVYTFNVATPLALKYKFPLTITGHEVLDQLFLSAETEAVMISSLKLNKVEQNLLHGTDFGTLTQDIKVAFRKAVSKTPYVPTN